VKRIILTLALILSPTISPTLVDAQDGYSVYSIVQPEYQLGQFRMYPPAGDGWRQVGTNAAVLRLVYAEILEDSMINTRADAVAEVFSIDTPDIVPSALKLTLNGQTQQMEERGDQLIGYTRIEKIESPVETHAYTLKVRISETTNRYETFFVSLAPDKSTYMVVKFTSTEEDYSDQSFFKEFVASYAKLTLPGIAEPADEPQASGDENQEPPADDDDAPGEPATP
jgi:hypothetical protein